MRINRATRLRETSNVRFERKLLLACNAPHSLYSKYPHRLEKRPTAHGALIDTLKIMFSKTVTTLGLTQEKQTKTPFSGNASVVKALLLLGLFSLNHAYAKPYNAAEIFTKNQERYGKYVVRMRAAEGSGIISNFFTYKNGSERSDVFWEEIDVEVFGKNGATSWQSNLITGFGPSRAEGVHRGPEFAKQYNTFTLEWTPSYVRWLINGTEMRRATSSQVSELSSPASFRFNIWPPNIPEWVGPLDQSKIPTAMFVNWVEYHKWEGGNQFSRVWRDNFDSFNSARWQKAQHTFAENLADFVPQNALVKNGVLILALTTDGQSGFSGSPPLDQLDPVDAEDSPPAISVTPVHALLLSDDG